MVVESRQSVLGGVGCVVERGVVADQDQLGALQAEHPVGLGPPPIVADRHSDDPSEGPPGPEPVRARLEVMALGVLELAPRLVVGMARDVYLTELRHHRAVTLHQDIGVVAVLCAVLAGVDLGVSEGEPDS